MHASLRRDMANDLITVMLFVQALSGEPDNVFLGHIAVPASRVVQGDKRAPYARPPLSDACVAKLCTCAAGREEGWYDLRGKQGDVIQGGDRAASVLMSLVASPAKPLPHHVQGFMLSKVSADVEDGDGFEKRYHLLNPYKQQLVIYTRLPLPGISEGLIHRSSCSQSYRNTGAAALGSTCKPTDARIKVWHSLTCSCTFCKRMERARLRGQCHRRQRVGHSYSTRVYQAPRFLSFLALA